MSLSKRNRRPRISTPTTPVHVTHVGHNRNSGEITGLPQVWNDGLFGRWLQEDERVYLDNGKLVTVPSNAPMKKQPAKKEESHPPEDAYADIAYKLEQMRTPETLPQALGGRAKTRIPVSIDRKQPPRTAELRLNHDSDIVAFYKDNAEKNGDDMVWDKKGSAHQQEPTYQTTPTPNHGSTKHAQAQAASLEKLTSRHPDNALRYKHQDADQSTLVPDGSDESSLHRQLDPSNRERLDLVQQPHSDSAPKPATEPRKLNLLSLLDGIEPRRKKPSQQGVYAQTSTLEQQAPVAPPLEKIPNNQLNGQNASLHSSLEEIPSRMGTSIASSLSTSITVPDDETARVYGLTSGHTEFKAIMPKFLQHVDSLGHGSLGVVEEVRISPDYATFVRKRVQLPYYRRKQYLDIIRQEAQVLKTLSHSHIVEMIGSYSEMPHSGQKQFYSLLMAPVGQRDLKTFLDIFSEQSATQTELWRQVRRDWLRTWFKCLSSALAYIHSKGVRHQDIKPSNIVHREATIYFTDFSSASEFDIGQTTSTENPARTSAMYAAPEVVNNSEKLNRHGRGTDVFALGGVFAEMLVVLQDNSIDEYFDFLSNGTNRKNGSENGHATQGARQPVCYAHKLGMIDTYFRGNYFYVQCIAPMLEAHRDQRPSAKGAATAIRGYVWGPVRSCACDTEFDELEDGT
ncbi:kinase-like domain-containing protein [Massariosphaeria phaeospora]|uniref:Kinase-like domain-containing protein n=1 Tax=Massariosphaeria phaeospora TaxID=100035 RepID=A0A7C8I9F5_9PLEO|nr:kinase-like domain-containing protein [Massariosphaeria phaeospora]